MLKFELFCFGILLATLVAVGDPALAESIQNCNRADELFNQSLENKDQQEALLQSALEVCPTHLQTLNNLGVIRENQNRLEEAVALYRRGIEIQPDFAPSYAGLGDVLVTQGNYRKAERAYRTLLVILREDRINGISNSFARHEATYRSKLKDVQSRIKPELVASADEISKALSGPSVSQKNKRGIRVVTHLPQIDLNINFKTNSDELTDQAWRQIEQIALALQKGKLQVATIRVEGHTDSDGDLDYNQNLSVRRAERVRNALHDRYSIDLQRLPITGYGETRPVASNANEHGKALNRRVTLVNTQP